MFLVSFAALLGTGLTKLRKTFPLRLSEAVQVGEYEQRFGTPTFSQPQGKHEADKARTHATGRLEVPSPSFLPL